MGRIIPYIMENKKCSKPPTRKKIRKYGILPEDYFKEDSYFFKFWSWMMYDDVIWNDGPFLFMSLQHVDVFYKKNLDDVVRFRGWICMEQDLVCFLCQEKSTDHKLYIIKKYNQVKVICHPTSIRAKNSQIIIYLSYWYLGARFRFLRDPIVRLIVWADNGCTPTPTPHHQQKIVPSNCCRESKHPPCNSVWRSHPLIL